MRWQQPPAGPEVDPRVEVRASVVQGRGLFATAPIGAGEVVVRLGGRLVRADELVRLLAAAAAAGAYVDTIAVEDDRHLVLPPGTPARFGNHSCDPTLWLGGPWELVARRAIATGEELTLDYATVSGGPGPTMACACGAEACRGEVGSDDWRRPELQARYGRRWVPVLLERIDRSG